MTWGAYFFFYSCPQCGKKYRWATEDMTDKDFSKCPGCHTDGVLVGETRDIQQGEASFQDYEYV